MASSGSEGSPSNIRLPTSRLNSPSMKSTSRLRTGPQDQKVTLDPSSKAESSGPRLKTKEEPGSPSMSRSRLASPRSPSARGSTLNSTTTGSTRLSVSEAGQSSRVRSSQLHTESQALSEVEGAQSTGPIEILPQLDPNRVSQIMFIIRHMKPAERTRDDLRRIWEVLSANPFLKSLDVKQRMEVLNMLQYRRFRPDETLIEQGTVANEMFVILIGTAGIYRRDESGNEVLLKEAHPGDTLGEAFSLSNDTVNLQEVRAFDTIECLSLLKADYVQVASEERIRQRAREHVFNVLVSVQPQCRSGTELETVLEYLRQRVMPQNEDESSASTESRLLAACRRPVPEKDLIEVCQQAEPFSVAEGDLLCREGDDPDGCYIILRGTLEVVPHTQNFLASGDQVDEQDSNEEADCAGKEGKKEVDASESRAIVFCGDDIVGEWGCCLGSDLKRSASLIATSYCELIFIPKATYIKHLREHRKDEVLLDATHTILGQDYMDRSAQHVAILETFIHSLNLIFFQALDTRLRKRLCAKMKWTRVLQGQVLFHEGDDGTALYVVLQGKLGVFKKLDELSQLSAEELVEQQSREMHRLQRMELLGQANEDMAMWGLWDHEHREGLPTSTTLGKKFQKEASEAAAEHYQTDFMAAMLIQRWYKKFRKRFEAKKKAGLLASQIAEKESKKEEESTKNEKGSWRTNIGKSLPLKNSRLKESPHEGGTKSRSPKSSSSSTVPFNKSRLKERPHEGGTIPRLASPSMPLDRGLPEDRKRPVSSQMSSKKTHPDVDFSARPHTSESGARQQRCSGRNSRGHSRGSSVGSGGSPPRSAGGAPTAARRGRTPSQGPLQVKDSASQSVVTLKLPIKEGDGDSDASSGSSTPKRKKPVNPLKRFQKAVKKFQLCKGAGTFSGVVAAVMGAEAFYNLRKNVMDCLEAVEGRHEEIHAPPVFGHQPDGPRKTIMTRTSLRKSIVRHTQMLRHTQKHFEHDEDDEFDDTHRTINLRTSQQDIEEAFVAVEDIGECVAEIARGQSCGDWALIRNAKRSATAVALQDTDCLVLDSKTFLEVMAAGSRIVSSNSEHAIRILKSTKPETRTAEDIHVLTSMLHGNEFFAELDYKIRAEICKAMTYEFLPEKKTLFRQGEKAECFYLILHGTVGVYIPRPEDEESDESEDEYDKPSLRETGEKFISKIEQGGTFGEWALAQNQERSATIRAHDNTELIKVTKVDYNKIMREHRAEAWKRTRAIEVLKSRPPGTRTEKEIDYLMSLLKTISFFNSETFQQSPAMQRDICKHISYLPVKEDRLLFCDGDPPDHFFYILRGCVGVYKSDRWRPGDSKQFRPGELQMPECIKNSRRATQLDIRSGPRLTKGHGAGAGEVSKDTQGSAHLSKHLTKHDSPGAVGSQSLTTSHKSLPTEDQNGDTENAEMNQLLERILERERRRDSLAEEADVLHAELSSSPLNAEILHQMRLTHLQKKIQSVTQDIDSLNSQLQHLQTQQEKRAGAAEVLKISEGEESEFGSPPGSRGTEGEDRFESHGLEGCISKTKTEEDDSHKSISASITASQSHVSKKAQQPRAHIVTLSGARMDVTGCKVELREGEVVGEWGVLEDQCRSASVRTHTNTELLVLDRNTFNRILKQDMVNRQQKKIAFLRKWLPGSQFSSEQAFDKLVSFFKEDSRPKGSAVVRAGEQSDTCWIITSGQCHIVKASATMKIEEPVLPQEEGTANGRARAPRTGTGLLSKHPNREICVLGEGQIIGLKSVLFHDQTESSTVTVASATVEMLAISKTDLWSRVPAKIMEKLKHLTQALDCWHIHRGDEISVICDNVVPHTERIRQEMEQQRRPRVGDSPYLRHKPKEKNVEHICARFGDWVPPECDWASQSRSAGFFKGCRLFSETEAEEKKALASSQKPFYDCDEANGYVAMTTLGANCKFNQLRDTILTERITKNHYLQGRPDSARPEDMEDWNAQLEIARREENPPEMEVMEKPALLPILGARVSDQYKASKWKMPMTSNYDSTGRPKKVDLPELKNSSQKLPKSTGDSVSTARRRQEEAENGRPSRWTQSGLHDGDGSGERQLPSVKDAEKPTKAKEKGEEKNMNKFSSSHGSAMHSTQQANRQLCSSTLSDFRTQTSNVDLQVGAGSSSARGRGSSSGNFAAARGRGSASESGSTSGQLRAYTFRRSFGSGFEAAPPPHGPPANVHYENAAPQSLTISLGEVERPPNQGWARPCSPLSPKHDSPKKGPSLHSAIRPPGRRLPQRRAGDVAHPGMTDRLVLMAPLASGL